MFSSEPTMSFGNYFVRDWLYVISSHFYYCGSFNLTSQKSILFWRNAFSSLQFIFGANSCGWWALVVAQLEVQSLSTMEGPGSNPLGNINSKKKLKRDWDHYTYVHITKFCTFQQILSVIYVSSEFFTVRLIDTWISSSAGTILQNTKSYKHSTILGSVCGTVDSAVASDTRGPVFESTHRQLF